MSTQAYYKERLGFDPDEVYEEFGPSGPKRLHGYEESLTKFKDERDAIQKKTFTKWVNKHLKKVNKKIDDLFEDLRDGHRLISLLEVLSRERLPRERGRMRFHMLQNVQTSLDYLRYRKIKLVNIRAEDIVDGNPKLILGLIWTIILHFQISDIMVGQEESMTAREALLRWAQKTTAKYPGVRVGDFAGSWKDGLAFNAIIHRNRPDLIDWRSLRNRQVRDRLDSAFTVAERECGVTRLLDPEDVDTPEPDEKSLITYISSLYDVFPEPPVLHPLYDPDTQRKYSDYRELSKALMSWIRHSIAVMQDRDFPITLIEMKKLASESARFLTDEVPSRQREKLTLFQIYKDIERFLEETGEYIEPELKPDVIERHWNQMLVLHEERDRAIQEEIIRLERLQRIAEKVHRDAKQAETKLGNLERQIEEEAKKIDRLHPADAKRNCDLIREDIDSLDDVIKSMFSDVQVLKDGRHNQANELHKRVQRIHQRWLSLRTLYQSRLVTLISTVDESRMSRTTLESRLFETNEHFRHLRDCNEWVKSKQKQIDDAEYGTDLPGVQLEVESHQKEQKAIERFQPNIDRCSQSRNNFHGEELQIYTTQLTVLLKSFSELQSKSVRRQTDLNALQGFIQSATGELIWLNEKEEAEVNRDWSAKGLDLNEIEQYYEALMSELEKREIQFSSVQDIGDSLLLQHHPASKTIEAYLAAMQTQWSWVLQLTLCLEYHLRQATIHHTFFAEVKECEHWVQTQDQLLNTAYSQSEFSLDEGERLLREMQGLREDLARYGDLVQALVERSSVVSPLRLRKQAIRQPLSVTAVCNYSTVNMSVSKDEPCQLLDNVQKTKWRVVNSSGIEGLVPGVCFSIPPPDAEALDVAEKLKRQYDRCVALWQKKQLRMRQNMIFATIKVVKSWDLQQFLAMGKEQRDAIRRALNEDADKLMSEGDPNDPQLKRLAREMAEVNRLFDEFEKRAAAGEGQYDSMAGINDQLANLEGALDDADQTLQAKIAAPVPRDVDTLEHLVIEHRSFETELQTIEVELNGVKVAVSQQPRKSSNSQQRAEKCVQTFERVWQTSRVYIERLKCVEIVLGGLEEATIMVSEFEIKLASYDKMPSTIDGLRKVHEDLVDVQSAIQVQQAVIDQLSDDMQTARRQVEKSRVNVQPARATPKRHPDVDRLEGDVGQVTVRWANVCSQVAERLQSVEAAGELLDRYNSQAKGTREWMNGMEEQILNGHAAELYNVAVERKQQMEDLNVAGGRLVREAKIFDIRLSHYKASLEEIQPSLDGVLSPQKQQKIDESAVEVISEELDELNRRYKMAAEALHTKFVETAIDGAESMVDTALLQPIQFKTFRTELNLPDDVDIDDLDDEEMISGSFQFPSRGWRHTSSLESDSSRTFTSITSIRLNQTSVTPIVQANGAPESLLSVTRKSLDESVNVDTVTAAKTVINAKTGAALTLSEAIETKIIDLESGEYVDKATGKRLPFAAAAALGLVSVGLARLMENQSSQEMSLLVNRSQAKTLPSDKMAVEEKYKGCVESVTSLVSWLANIEMQLASQECVREEPSDVKNQINAVKSIREDIDGHGRQVGNCVEQARQIQTQGVDLLTTEEISVLEKDSKELKTRYEIAGGQADKLHRKLGSALDELNKFRSEISAFKNWLNKAERGAEDKEKLVCNLNRQQVATEATRDFVSDVIAHQADLRFINMAAQKFTDESKEYTGILNDYRTSLPHRLQPVEVSDSLVRAEVTEAGMAFQDLMKRATKLQEKVANVGSKQKEYQDALAKARNWLKEVENRTTKILHEPLGSEPKVVEDQLSRAKSLNAEFLNNEKLIDNAQQATVNLLHAIEMELPENERAAVEGAPRDLESKYMKLAGGLQEKCKMLETALLQSQGVQEALDTLAGWLTNAENQMKNLTKPASLSSERLAEQLREHRLLAADVSAHVPSFESVNRSASDLISNPENARIARKIETRMKELNSRYEKVQEKVEKRSVFLEEVSVSLDSYVRVEIRYEEWYTEIIEIFEANAEPQVLAARIDDVARQRDGKREDVDELLRTGKMLVAKKDVTDTQPIKDKLKVVELQWKDLNDLIEENQRDGKARSEQLQVYERLRIQVVEWLTVIETRVERLEPVALDAEAVKKQNEELKPIAKEHRDYGPTIDKVVEAGTTYDSLSRGERGDTLRRRSSVTPLKRTSLSGSFRRPSQDLRSPTKLGSSFFNGGSGSRRSSDAYFGVTTVPEDASPVQSQLNEILNRYATVGTKVSDRQAELDSMKDEAKKHAEALQNLVATLDKLERQLPKDTNVPATKEEAEKLLKNVKNLLEDMYDKQPQLDALKNSVVELIRKKPDVPGIGSLQSNVDGVASRWKELLDRMKARSNVLEQAKEFQELCDQLNAWLQAKDKMLGVLGPVASDPRLVHNQLQQVQVLYDEFKEQERNVNNLDTLLDALMGSTDPSSNEAKKIQEKVGVVNSRWTDLIARLEDRRRQLDAASGMSKQFSANLNKLLESLQKISDETDDLSVVKGDVEEALEKINALEYRLEAQRPLLAEVESTGNELCHILSDSGSMADVTSKIQQVDKTYNRVQKKLDNKKAELESQIKDTREFVDACESIQDWIKDYSNLISEKMEVSADRDTLKQQVIDFEPVYKEVMNKEHEVIMMLNRGQEILQSSKKSDTKQQLKALDLIRSDWDKVKGSTVEKKTRLEKAHEMCKKYYVTLESFFPWLEEVEVKISSMEPVALKKQDLEKQIKELSAFKNEISRHSGGYDSTKTLGESFLTVCDVHKEGVKEDLGVVKQRWEVLNNAVQERGQMLDDFLSRLGEFNDQLRSAEHILGRCEDRLTSHDALGDASRDPKLLERVKALLDEAKSLEKKLAPLEKLAESLVNDADAVGSDGSHIVDDAEALIGRYKDLRGQLEERCSSLEAASQAVARFTEQLKSALGDLSGLEHEFESMTPPARELGLLQSQLDQVATFFGRIEHFREQLEETCRVGEDLTGNGREAQSNKEQTSNIMKQITKLEDKAKTRHEEVEKVFVKMESFYEQMQMIMENVETAAKDETKFKAVSADVEVIRQQQAEFQAFCDEHRDALGKDVTEANKVGQGLVQSAASGVSTSQLEGDLEKMNDKWNALKTKLFERERKLDAGLLQSGKFREALDSLGKWLSDTEEMVVNQKPPSADYKVVKAQLQEQKFLKKLLFDRQHSMSSLLDMGHDLASRLDTREKKDLEEIMQELVARFDALSHSADERMKSLNTAMSVAKEFWDQFSPIVDWLEKSEKKIRDMEVVPTDEDKIQYKIEEHDLLHDEIVAKRPSFETLSDTASTLMSLVGDEEANALADKLADLTDRYAGIVEASDSLGQLLADAKQGLRHLVLSYEDLVAWMEDTETRLTKYKILSVYIEKLVEQMEEITDLTEEVTAHQQNVDNVVDTGLELMRHISNEEALQLKDKLDSIQRRHNDLTARASDLLKNTQETLPLVQQFHETHGRLSEWLMDAESRLQALESGTTSSNVTAQEEEIMALEADLSEVRPLLEIVNITGPQLCQRARGEGAATIEGLVQRDNRRFDSICEQIQRRGERLQLAKQRSMEVVGDLDDLLEWCRETESQLREADQPSTDPDVIRVQLKEHKAMNEDIASQKSRVRDVLSAAKKVIREQNDESGMIREKMDDLKETMETVVALSFERLSVLEQALPLAEHFFEAHVEIVQWLDEVEQDVAMLEAPALRADQIVKQQEFNKHLTAAVTDHKPLVDKLNKSGTALVKLCVEEEAAKVQELLDSDNARYGGLRASLRERQQALEEALQETSQFADKLDGMLAALSSTADQIKSAEPISAHPDKLQEQIAENAAIVEDLEKRESAFETVKQAAEDVIQKATSKNDPAVRDITAKMDKLSKLWDNVVSATNERGKSLEEALAVAEKFWDELQNVLSALKDLQDTLNTQDPPAVEPGQIQQQKVALEEIKSEIEQTKPDVEACKSTGLDLISLCGEQDKPEIKKHIEDLDFAWDNVTALFAKREENLIDAMEKAMEFHDTLRYLLEFLEDAENRFTGMRPIGSDIDSVKEQIDQLKKFKLEVDPAMVQVESLNRQAAELTERTSPDQAAALKEPLGRVNRRWDELAKGIVERQRDLEHALLRLGQFQHALAELMVWINKTDGTLDELKPVFGDPAVIEVELAKLKVLVNDIQAHQNSVETLNDAGMQLVEADRGSDDANRTQQKLSELNQNWEDVVQKSSLRQKELEDALKEAQMFHADIQDLLLWLSDIDSALSTSKPVGGLPETAAEQLQRFMGVYDELEENRPKVETILEQGAEYLKRSSEGAASSLQHNLKILKQRWDAIMNRANDKKIKLEIALKEATEFHEQLQAFIDWLTDAEKVLTGLKPASRVLDTVTEQIEEHKTFQKNIGAQREVMLSLDKKGTHLKYFSQKQDVILIKNLLISVQHRWERVLTKAAERTRALDHGYKEAKEFSDAYNDLNTWLDNATTSFDESAQTLGKDPDKIKQLLQKHKEFQRALGAKQPTYDAIMRMGKMLKDRAPKSDEPAIKQLMTDLKNKWQDVCNRSVDRQRKLEEGLLFSGQFKDALQALVDWLCKVELGTMKDGPVHGDLDTVIALKEQHKNFEDEFAGRLPQTNQVRKTANDLLASANPDDAAAITAQVQQLDDSWKKVSEAAKARSGRLEDALGQAEELHRRVNMLLEWLSDGEMKLRFAGQLPEDQDECIDQIGDHKRFLQEMGEKEREKDGTLGLANDILSKCHPDAVGVIRHWITIIQSRWEEVSNWARQREHRLEDHVKQLRDSAELLEELLQWLIGQETILVERESEPLPDDIPTISDLVEEHNQFMEDTSVRTPDIDRVCKPKQQPKLSTSRKPSRKSITSAPDRDFRRSMSRETSPEYEPPSRRSSQKPASRESTPGPVSPRKASQAVSDRSSPGRETSPIREYPKPWMTNVARSSPSRDGEELQHYGPRFLASAPSVAMLRKGSKPSITEPVIKNPRARHLWDKWRNVWVMAWDRQRRLNERRGYLDDVEQVKHFSWDDWRRRFMRFMNGKKSRVTDLFRKMDKSNEGAIPREDFIDGIIRTKFPTSRLEMEAVANMFDRNSEGYIDWKEFMAALRPDWEEKPNTDSEKIHDEVKRQVQKCTCKSKFRVHQVGEGKYRFGESQKLRLVRILRSTVMVRVGGGWVALDEFLVKNDPCRAKGRTNVELREQFVLAEGVSQSLSPFKTRPNGSISGPSGSAAVPTGRTSHSQSLPTAGPIMKIKEMTPKSFPMQQRPPGRSSVSSARTPDSSTSEDGSFRLHSSARKGSAPVRSFNASQPPSRPASRSESRQNSRPPSRQNSNLSLDSTDDVSKAQAMRRTPSFAKATGRTPSQPSQSGRIPAASTPVSYNSLPRRTAANRTRNPSGSSSGTPAGTPVNGTPASASRSRLYKTTSASNIPTLTGQTPNRSRIPVFVSTSVDFDTISESETPRNRAVSHAGLQNRPPFLTATNLNHRARITTSSSNIPVLVSTTPQRNRSTASSTSASSTPSTTPVGSSKLVQRVSGASDSPTAQDRKGTPSATGLRKPSNYTPKK